MPIIYSLISRGPNVLAEYTSSGLSGNFSTVSRVLLKKIDLSNNKCSYVYDKYIFHYIVNNNIIYLSMTHNDFNRSIAFQYLSEVQERFIQSYGDRAQSAIAFAFNQDFQRVLANLVEKYNNLTTSGDKITQINKQLGEVKDAMLSNIDNVLQRGEKIELLVDKTETLEQHAFKFQRGAKALKRQMCIKNIKWTIALLIVLGLVIYIILAIACGETTGQHYYSHYQHSFKPYLTHFIFVSVLCIAVGGGDLPKCK
jgi:vesicle-associated membrane protein 7